MTQVTGEHKSYKHIVSLGSFCSPALELERFGYRDISYPFDWLITRSFPAVITLIESHFEGWLSYEDLYQRTKERNVYEDPGRSIAYVHDFNKYTPLKDQLGGVQDKYNRRIERFFEYIQEPTLFIRYIHPTETMDYVVNNYDQILACLRKNNTEDDIVFFANKETIGNATYDSRIVIYPLDPDEGDVVARRFFEQAKEFTDILEASYSPEERRKNTSVFQKKEQAKRDSKFAKKTKTFIDKIVKKEYVHDKNVEDYKRSIK